MKKTIKILAVFLCAVMLVTAFPATVAAGGTDMNSFLFPSEDYGINLSVTKKVSEINIRDPFVLVYGQTYFMYGTGAANGPGYGCYVSRDLENWAGPVNVFTAPAGFEGTGCFWAPECHYYNGSFYLFATYYSEVTKHRGVSVFRANNPLGPFEQISDGSATSKEWDAIDGTLYVDEGGQPWMVFVHEWTCMPNGIGDFSAAKLSSDLSHFISEPISLFKADAPSWATNGVTDGCFMYKTSQGKLIMLWSGYDSDGYCVAAAESSDGTLSGKWSQQPKRIYSNTKPYTLDGGHPMVFNGLDGKMYLSIHSPNGRTDTDFEKPAFYEIVDTGDTLVLQDTLDYRQSQKDTFTKALSVLFEIVTIIFTILRSTDIGKIIL